MSRQLTRLEDAMMKRMNRMEQRLEEVARQGRKEQTDIHGGVFSHNQYHQEEANCESEDEEGVAWSGEQRHGEGGVGHGDQAGWVREQAG